MSFNYDKAPASKVIDDIEKNTKFKFLFNRETIDVNFNVTLVGKYTNLSDVLDGLFSSTDLGYTINDDQIILTSRKQTASTNKVFFTSKVVDENSEPLPGANVCENGIKNGTVTDRNGIFTLSLSSLNSSVNVSFIGFRTKTVLAKDADYQVIMLLPESNNLSEVISIGYGSLKKSDLTGSVTSVKVKNIESTTFVSVDQFLKGKSSGVYINTASAEPAGLSTTRIRGVNSLTADNEPLYVVDGVAMETVFGGGDPFTKTQQNTNPLAYLNPQDISNIEILKDASATAIYGSRGTNGVILITTKEGVKGPIKVNFMSSLTVSTVRKKIDMLSGPNYANYRNEVSLLGGGSIIYGKTDATKPENLEWKDWQNEVLQESISKSSRVSISGGNSNSTFYIAVGNTDNQGIIKNTSFSRNDFRFNFNYDINKEAKLSLGVVGSRIADRLTQTTGSGTATNFSAIRSMVSKTPILTYVPNGTDADANLDLPTSWEKDYKDENMETSIISRLGFTYQLSKMFNYELKLGTSFKQGDRYRYYGRTLSLGNNIGVAGYSSLAYMGVNVDNLLHFTYTFNKMNVLSAVVGTTYSNNSFQTKTSNVSGFPDDLLGYEQYGAASIMGSLNMDHSETLLNSYIARANYTFQNKYLFTVSARIDGSSKFSEGHRYGTFPSAAFAWRASEENFLKNVELLSNLKFRLGWGQTGNQGIRAYDTKARYGYPYTITYPYGGTNHLGLPLSTNQLGLPLFSLENSNLTWEKSDQVNLGIDLGMFKEKISLNIDLYSKKSTNMLIRKDLPPSAGILGGKTIVNYGSMQNQGVDITLNTIPLNGKLKWTLDGNFSLYRNKILNLGLPVTEYGYVRYFGGKVHDVGELQQPVNTFIEGKPSGLFFGYKTLGVFQNQAQIDAFTATHTQPASLSKYYFNRTAQPGDIIFQDTNQDGVISAADYTIIGNPNPDFTWGLNSSLSYKQWNVEVSIVGVEGKDVFNANLNTEDIMNGGYPNIRQDAWNARWQGEGTSNTFPAAKASTIASVISDRLVEDASYIRLSNVTLSYTLKFPRIIKELKLFTSGNNLLTITKYRGFDPEVDSYGGSPNRFGIDNNSYPASKSFIFGMNIYF
jgi:TonB-linked SusC/RagA family outer membrane protein